VTVGFGSVQVINTGIVTASSASGAAEAPTARNLPGTGLLTGNECVRVASQGDKTRVDLVASENRILLTNATKASQA
jgi:hypothetical protein